MKQKALLLAALLLAVGAPQVAWGQEFGQHLNLKGKEALYVWNSLPSYLIEISPSDAPPGFDREAVGRELVSRLREVLQAGGIPVREAFHTIGTDADLGLLFSIFPIRRGGIVEGYAISGYLSVDDWTSHRYPVTIWRGLWVRITNSKTASELRSDLLRMIPEMILSLIADWNKANR